MICIVSIAFVVTLVAFILLIQEIKLVCKKQNYNLNTHMSKETIVALLLVFWVSMLLFPFIAYILLTPYQLSMAREILIAEIEAHIKEA